MKPRRSGCRRKCRGQRGAALLLFLIVFLTVGLAMLFRGTPTPEGLRFAQRERTEQVLMQAKAALIGYAATYRDTHPDEMFGYLPCPDSDGDGHSNTNTAGSGCNGSAGRSAVGLLPYKTLGLPELRDQDGGCLWYAVSGTFKADTNKFVPMNWDTQGRFAIRDATSADLPTPVILVEPNDLNGGAAAIIIAAGMPLPNRPNRSAAANTCGVNPAEVAAYLDGDYNFGTTGTVNLNHGLARDADGIVKNNDLMAWVTPKEIFSVVRRRSDFAASINALINDVAVAITEHSTFWTGDTFSQQMPTSAMPSTPYYQNWKDQFRVLKKCNSEPCPALTRSGTQCAAALFFINQRPSDGPRTNDERSQYSSWLEGNRRSVWEGGATDFTGIDTYPYQTPPLEADRISGDISRCLHPPSISLARDFDTLTSTAVTFPDPALSMVRLNSTTKTITLGSEGLHASASTLASSLFGCAWFGSAIPFGNGIRAFFKFIVRKSGNGFVLALVDADRNPSTTMCGAAGMHLGYSGTGGKSGPSDASPDTIVNGQPVQPILYPKIGLEIDMHRNDGFSDPPNLETTGRNDLTSTAHAAVVFWGHHAANPGAPPTLPPITAPGWDDNVHGSPATGYSQSPYVSPQNPPYSNTLTGIDGLRTRSYLAEEGSDQPKYIRLEIDRLVISGGRRYVIRAWMSESRSGLDNLAQPYPPGDSAIPPVQYLTTTRDVFDFPGTPAIEALKNIRVGFTNSAGGDDQEIEVTEFTLRGVD